ncbi:MAG: helix-hairpin-helix domain-containing protein [Candidatus Acidiferrales bacterium]
MSNIFPYRSSRTVIYLSAAMMLAVCLFAGAFSAQATGKKLPPPSKPIDLNTATSEQLQRLPGVGPVTAQRILDYRKKSGPFQSVDDLLAVKGISTKRLDKIRQYVMVKAPPAPAQAPPKTPPKKP